MKRPFRIQTNDTKREILDKEKSQIFLALFLGIDIPIEHHAEHAVKWNKHVRIGVGLVYRPIVYPNTIRILQRFCGQNFIH